MPINYGTNDVTSSGNVNISGVITGISGVFNNLTVGGSSSVTGTGIASHIAYWNSTSGIVADSGQLYWDATNNRLGIGTTTPSYQLDITGSGHFTQNAVIDGDCVIGVLKAYKFNGNAWGYDRIIFRSDVNNKITSDANGNYNWLVAGRNWTLSDVGNVGIGTLSPGSKLTVVGTGSFTNIDINSSAISGQGALTVNGGIVTQGSFVRSSIFSLYGDNNAQIYKSDGSTLAYVVSSINHNHLFGYNNLGTPVPWATINSTGLGIGTTTPSGRLNVIGTGLFSTTTGIAPNALLDLYSAISGDMIFNVEGTNGSLFSVIDNLSGSLMSVNNNAGLPVFEVFSDDRVVGGRYNQNDFVISSGGNVGIGTASPTSKLHVIGTGNFSQNVLVNGISVRNTTLSFFTAIDNQPPASGFATLDTRNSIAVLDFDDATEESCVFIGAIPDNANLASGLSVRIHWMATSATTGNCRWGVQFEDMNTDEDTDSFDTATEAHSATNGTAGIPTTTTITCTTIDSLVAGDFFRIKIYRDVSDTTNDTMTGDAELIGVEVRSVL